MKAVVVTQFGSSDVLQVRDVEVPQVGANEVRIRTVATSVNFADIKSRAGRQRGTTQPPFIPGLDVAGIVDAVGSDVQRFHVGQRVAAFPKAGSYAEYVVANEALTFLLPDSVDMDTAAACPIVSFTAYKLLADVARLQEGESVLIHAAAGGVGTTAIQLAKLMGAGTVIGTVGNPNKMKAALQAGADHVVCYEEVDFAAQVNELTDGRGVDVILDSIAGRVSEESMNCLAMYGRLAHFGNASGEVGQFKTKDLHASCRSVLGFSLGTTRKERPHLLKSAADNVFRYLGDGRLTMHIGRRFALKQAAEAHEWVESRQSTGKVLLTV